MKKHLFLLAISFFLFVCSCSQGKPDEFFDIQDTVGNCKISIGMEKENVDEILGEPFDGGSLFLYKDTLGINYEGGKITAIIINTNDWKTKDNITIGNKPDEVLKIYGNSASPESKNSFVYFYDSNGNNCEIDSAVKSMVISIDERTDEVKTIMISEYKSQK